MTKRYLDMNIDDALIEKPHRFSVGAEGRDERHFYLFPVTLGKMHLLKRHIDNLGIDMKLLSKNPFAEALRLSATKKRECCRLLAYHTFKRKRDIFDNDLVDERIKFFMSCLSVEELASILIIVLTRDDVEKYKAHLGIAKENERMRKVMEAKRRTQKTQHDFSFGCKSIYGTLIDTACERYGWSYEYVLWGISLTNLQLMLADRMQSVYLSDDEKRKVGAGLLQSGDSIKADDKANMERILSMNWK